MIYLSASSIKDFLSCERKYWYRRYAKDKAVESTAVTFGSLLHYVIETYWDDEDSARKYVNLKLDSVKEEKRAQLMLSNFFDFYRPMLSDKDTIEQTFKINYPRRDDVKFVGKFDRVLPNNIMIDWKTSRRLPKNLENDPQFLLYHYAYTQLYGKEPRIYYAHLQSGRLIPFKINGELFKILESEIIPNMLSTIEGEHFEPDGLYRYTTCDFCFYKLHCHDTLGLEEYNELDREKFNFR